MARRTTTKGRESEQFLWALCVGAVFALLVGCEARDPVLTAHSLSFEVPPNFEPEMQKVFVGRQHAVSLGVRDSDGGLSALPRLSAYLLGEQEVRSAFIETELGSSEVLLEPRNTMIGGKSATEFATSYQAVFVNVTLFDEAREELRRHVVAHRLLFGHEGRWLVCELKVWPEDYEVYRSTLERFCSSIEAAGPQPNENLHQMVRFAARR